MIARLLEALGEGFDGAVPGAAGRRHGQARARRRRRRDARARRARRRADAAGVRRVGPPRGARGAVEGSDCASLVEAAGGRVTVVAGDERLLKVTTRADLERVAAWL